MAEKLISRVLRQVRLRLVIVRAVESGLSGAVRAAGLAAGLMALSALAYSFLPAWYRDSFYPAAPLLLIPAALVVAMIWRMARPVSLREAAVYLDRRAGFDERVSTAYELLQQNERGGLGPLVFEQAREVCQGLRPGMIPYSRRLQRETRFLVVALVVCVGVLFIPPYKTDAFVQREIQQKFNEQAAKGLETQIKRVAGQEQGDPALRDLLARANEAALALRNPAADPESQRAALERIETELARLRSEIAARQELARSVAEARKSKEVGAALDPGGERQRQDLANRAANGQLTAEEKSALARVGAAAEKAGQASGEAALQKSGQNVNQAASAAGGGGDAKTLAKDLEKLAQAAGAVEAKAVGGVGEEELAALVGAAEQAKQGLVSVPSPRGPAAGNSAAKAAGTGSGGPAVVSSSSPVTKEWSEVYVARATEVKNAASSPSVTETGLAASDKATANEERQALEESRLPAEVKVLVRKYFEQDVP